jgi:hypothetical protein
MNRRSLPREGFVNKRGHTASVVTGLAAPRISVGRAAASPGVLDISHARPPRTQLDPGRALDGRDLNAAALVGVGPKLFRLDVKFPVELAVLGAVVREGIRGERQLELE